MNGRHSRMRIDDPRRHEAGAPRSAAGPREEAWVRCAADEAGEVIVAALAAGGVDKLFFCSGSDIGFLQEAVAKARALGRPSPELITVMHESVALNAAVGYSVLTRCPAATAVHVEVGALSYGAALHTANAERAPVMMISGASARAYPGSARGARNNPINWVQERFDQRVLASGYAKWTFRLELQDNPGLVVSRGLQLALSEPMGPAFLSIPREVGMAAVDGGCFPSAGDLGIAIPPAPDPEVIDRLASWLASAERPLIIAGSSGRDPTTVPLLARVAELIGARVTGNGWQYALNIAASHPLSDPSADVSEADVLLVVDNDLPWVANRTAEFSCGQPSPGTVPTRDPKAPRVDCRVACVGLDPTAAHIPLLELSADLRICADPRRALSAIVDALEDRLDAHAREQAKERIAVAAAAGLNRRRLDAARANEVATRRPIDPRWVAHTLSGCLDFEAVLLNESLSSSLLIDTYCMKDRPGSYLSPRGTGGGWGSGAALGVKLAAPERDVVLVSGDGFYAYGVPAAALWSAVRQGAGYVAVVLVNSRYSTGTSQHAALYPDGYSETAGFPGGTFDPPPDFAAEAVAAGAFGITVSDPEDLQPALHRGLNEARDGRPAVVAVRVA
jgi:acetolactate synthase-1/2/3 large subunit